MYCMYLYFTCRMYYVLFVCMYVCVLQYGRTALPSAVSLNYQSINQSFLSFRHAPCIYGRHNDK